MDKQSFTTALDILWHETEGPKITTDPVVSEMLAKALVSKGVNVIKVGKKPRARGKWILFTIVTKGIVGMEQSFLTEEEAQEWHIAKNRGLNTLMKAPDEAFEPVKTEDREMALYWNQTFKLAHRIGCNLEEVAAEIMKHRGRVGAEKIGLL